MPTTGYIRPGTPTLSMLLSVREHQMGWHIPMGQCLLYRIVDKCNLRCRRWIKSPEIAGCEVSHPTMKLNQGKAMRFKIFAVLAFLSIGIQNVHADGNSLLQHCKAAVNFLDTQKLNGKDLGVGLCFGFAEGVAMTLDTYSDQIKKPVKVCLPKDIAKPQLVRVLTSYLEAHPEKLHHSETTLGVVAFASAFPCPS